MQEFLEKIYGNATGTFDILTFDRETRAPDSERWIAWPQEKGLAAKYIELREEDDVYVSVAMFSDEKRTDRDLGAVSKVVWADADKCHPDNFRVKPSIVVETSPDRWHVWWVLDKPVPAAEASRVSRKISSAHKAQGCDNGWQVSKILRVPGTTNTKYAEPFKVSAEYSDKIYSLKELEDEYSDISVEAVTQLTDQVPEPIQGEDLLALEHRLEELDLVDLYMTKPEEGQSWSERIYRLACELTRAGMTEREIFSLMRDAPINKYATTDGFTASGVPLAKRPNPDLDLWRDVQKAYADAEEYTNEPATPLQADLPPLSLLSLAERQFLSENPMFPDEYEEWALSRSPDSPSVYHRSLSWMVLAGVLADKVFLNLKWGEIHPNLWMFIMGETTRYRKTTSMEFATGLIERVDEALLKEPTYIGSDATSEALIQELGEREGMSSLVYTDEINGFFAEMFTKNYRMGTMETYTKLYNGRVPVVLRSTKGAGNRKHVRATLNYLGGGIQSKLSSILHREHFESGFLLRATWAVPERIYYEEGSSDIQLPDPDQKSMAYDPTLSKFVRRLSSVSQAHDWKEPSEIGISLGAFNRLNEFVHAMHVYAAKIGDSVVDAGIERLRDSVLKAAILLAAFEREKEISEPTMLRAILQGEEWFSGLVSMVSSVSQNDFGRKQDEVISFISAGKDRTRTEDEIFRKFTYRPLEFREMIDSLRLSGRVRLVQGQDRKKWQALV